MARAAFLLTALALAAGPARGPAADPKAVETPKSPQKPSADAAEPAPLKLGRYAAGRLGDAAETGRHHYWAIDLAAGDYTVVLDGHRTDGSNGHVGLGVRLFDAAAGKPVGVSLATVNSPWGRDRAVGSLKVKEAGPAVFRVENGSAMAEYQLAVVKQGDGFSTPWLVKRPEVRELRLGVEVTTPKLDGDDLFGRDAYYAVELPEGDFKVTATFTADNPRVPNSGVKVDLLNLDGKHVRSVASEYGSKPAGQATAKLATAGVGRFLVRVRGCSAGLTATLVVEEVRNGP